MTIDFTTTHAADAGSTLLSADAVYTELGITTPTAQEQSVVAAAIAKIEGSIKKHLRYNPVQATRTEYYPLTPSRSASGESVWESSGDTAYLREIGGAGANELQLAGLPVRSITTLHVDYGARFGTVSGSFAASSLKTLGTDYWLNTELLDSAGARVCMDGIVRSFGLWPTEPGAIKLVYVSGYTSAELLGNDSVLDASPIYYVAVEEAARYARRVLVRAKDATLGHLAGPLTSERLGDYSYNVDASGSSSELSMNWELMPSSIQRLSEFVNFGIMLAQ